MKTIASNPCIRCGKERIESKSWVETLETFYGKTTITHTETVCPDAECQKIVDAAFAKQKEKTEGLKHDREERLKLSAANRKKNKAD